LKILEINGEYKPLLRMAGIVFPEDHYHCVTMDTIENNWWRGTREDVQNAVDKYGDYYPGSEIYYVATWINPKVRANNHLLYKAAINQPITIIFDKRQIKYCSEKYSFKNEDDFIDVFIEVLLMCANTLETAKLI